MMSFIINYYHNACSVRDARTSIVYRLRMGGRKRFEYATCGCFFSEKGRKNLRFQKYLDTRERVLRVASLCISFHGQYPNVVKQKSNP